MRFTRLIVVALLVAVLLLMAVFTTYSESQGYSRFNNPGNGHDWQIDAKNNSNDNSNTQHNENGYRNHATPAPGPTQFPD